MVDLLVIFFSAILINNFVLSRFLGICPFLGVSQKIETAVGMGFAVIFVMGLASAITYIFQRLLLALHVEVLQTLTFILVIAVLVQFVEMVLKKMSPGLYRALGIYLPLITTKCAVLGVALLNANVYNYDFLQSVIHGVAAAVGFTLVMVVFAGSRERWAAAPIPNALRGFPLALVTAGLLSLAFLGFMGFDLKRLFVELLGQG
ncbi:MAG: electron transport complex subunit RsxA [Firmicutes bacterium]|nr:electron transport complex subunit RsxA [Bacillota bacterium]